MTELTIDTQVTLDPVTCCVCGALFGINREMNRELRRTGGTFYCPSGHRQYYAENEVDRLKKQLASQKEQARILAAQLDNEAARRRQTELSLRATKAALTKVKKRVGKGVCPECNRTFKKLQDHMATKHPDYGTVDD